MFELVTGFIALMKVAEDVLECLALYKHDPVTLLEPHELFLMV